MASHGVPRVQAAGPKSEKAREKELKEIEEYKELVDKVTTLVNAKAFSHETLRLTSELLKKNPEYYTMWNYRRRILTHLLDSAAVEAQEWKLSTPADLITSDLAFLMPLLISYPKCYWIWNHRLWLLQQTSARLSADDAYAFWRQELDLVGRMLTRDSRNFHGWDYRRIVISALRRFDQSDHSSVSKDKTDEAKSDSTETSFTISLTEQEFAYTTKMIRANLSNFSAWHYRSKLIPRLLEERQASLKDQRKMFDDELKIIDEALSLDPYDQSLWFYHQYLMAELSRGHQACFGSFTVTERTEYLRKEIDFFRDVVEDFDDCKWIFQNLLELSAKHLDIENAQPLVTEQETRSWLSKLQDLDPLRIERWKDLEKRLCFES